MFCQNYRDETVIHRLFLKFHYKPFSQFFTFLLESFYSPLLNLDEKKHGSFKF
jgi:hypothetical protein